MKQEEAAGVLELVKHDPLVATAVAKALLGDDSVLAGAPPKPKRKARHKEKRKSPKVQDNSRYWDANGDYQYSLLQREAFEFKARTGLGIKALGLYCQCGSKLATQLNK